MSLCDNCIHYDVCGNEDAREEAVKVCDDFIDKSVLSVPEGEYINKAELIKRMLGHINRFTEEKNFSMNEGMKYAQGVIGGMPTFAVPEREKGEWVRWYEKIEGEGVTAYEPHCKCPKCNKEQDPYESKFIYFCPNCGADMRGGKE